MGIPIIFIMGEKSPINVGLYGLFGEFMWPYSQLDLSRNACI